MERQPKLYAMAPYKIITDGLNLTLFNDEEISSPINILSGKNINTVLAPVRIKFIF